MNFTQLTAALDKKYSIRSITDLAELTSSPGSAYQFFYSLYQTEFDTNDRIVIYTSRDIPTKLLTHLYQAVNFVDISNWFILICSPNDISHQLLNIAKEYSSNPVAFQHCKVPLNQTATLSDQYHLPDTICAKPWSHLEIRNDGSITPCCVSSNATIGNITTTTLDTAFHSDHINSLRTQFLAGNKPSECNTCWKNESRGLSSIRTHNINRLKKEFLLEQLQNPVITSIDIQFNNTCNFKCRICSPMSSSLIAAEHKKFLNVPVRTQTNWSESDSFIDQLSSKLSHLKNIDMFGGEPFLIKKFANVLQTAVEQGHAKNIRLHYNSNGSIWPGEFLPYWPHFKEVDIHFSIDAIGRKFELQRGGSWAAVEENILNIKKLNLPNLIINLMPNINIMSVYYLDEVYDWAVSHNLKLFAGNLTKPAEFGLSNLTKQAQDLIVNKFQNHPWDEMQNVVKLIKSTPPSTGESFVAKIKWLDSIRQENFAESHPEIAKAMGYVYTKQI
jgi:radical SAM protein with 4Fe4S-binding SPASM domain